LRPDSGHAKIFGHDVVREPTAVRSLVGVTGQYASVDEDLTATENLIVFSRLLGLSRAAARRKTVELLEEFSLTEAADKPLKEFSGGMRRRLDLAAGLIAPMPDPAHTPELLIRLRDHGIGISEINVQKPSLDEVFLTLTGHGAESAEPDRSVA